MRYLKISYRENPELADELTQEVYLKVIRYKDRFVGQTDSVKWGNLVMMYRNVCCSYLKRIGTMPPLPDGDLSGDGGESAEPESAPETDVLLRLVRAETIAHLRDAIDRLGSPAREIVVERYCLNRSYAEIAQMYGMREGTVASVLHRSLKKLRKELEEYVAEDH